MIRRLIVLLLIFVSCGIVPWRHGSAQDEAVVEPLLLPSVRRFSCEVDFLSATRQPDEADGGGEQDDGSEEDGSGNSDISVAELSKNLDELTANYEQLQSDYEELRSDLKYRVESGHGSATMQLSGRIHLDHWGFPGDSPGVNAFESGDPTITPQDRIGFRRLRFGVGGDVWHNMIYRIEMEFAGGHDPEFRDAFLGFTELPVLQTLRFGNQKRPYGLDHWNSSRYNVFLERPFVIEAFNQDNRRLGICSWGVSEDRSWNWQYGVFNQRLVQDEGNYISDHYQGQVAGRLANTFWYDESSDGRGYAHWGIAGTVANTDGSNNGSPPPPNAWGRADNEARFRTRPEARSEERWLDTGVILGADQYELLGLEGVLNVGPVQIVSELQNVWLQRNGGGDLHFHGAYVYVSYFLTGEHMPWDRDSGQLDRIVPYENFFLVDRCNGGVGSGCGAWQVALRLSYLDLSDHDILGGIGESITFGVNWFWNPYARLQFNYSYGLIHDHEPVAGQTFGDYHIVGTRFNIDF